MPSDGEDALSLPQYWDDQYAQRKGHEWFRSFTQLEPFFQKNLLDTPNLRPEDDPRILHLGSGDSTVPADLAAYGYKRHLCVDFSQVVVDLMTERHSQIEGIKWQRMDVRQMDDIANQSIDVAFDKGTLDAMIHGSPWSPPDDVLENTARYLREVHRVLKDSGMFLYITFRQPHFITPLLSRDELWDREMQVLGEEGSFDYYAFVLRKR